MVIGGRITAGKASGQKELRAIAIVLAKVKPNWLSWLRYSHDHPPYPDPEETPVTGIPAANILIIAHTHHAPSTPLLTVMADEKFTRRVQEGIVKAARVAATIIRRRVHIFVSFGA
jgi:hypothetical protein